MALLELESLLVEHRVPFEVIDHRRAYTASRTAQAAHIPGRHLAKTVVVLADECPALVVVSAAQRVDLAKVRQALGAAEVRLAREEEFAGLFPQCEPGAIPPFGVLFDMPVVVDEAIAADKWIAFSAGTHRELLRVNVPDFERIACPLEADVTLH
jgi:Ala-tRNA(Pro) deacylase